MKILYDFRQYQAFYPRGVSHYAIALFSETMRQLGEPCGILWDSGMMKPSLPADIAGLAVYYTVDDFTKGIVSDFFDVFLNGSANWLGLKTDKVLDVLYPEAVLARCLQKGCIVHDFVPMLFQGYLPTDRDKRNYAFQNAAVSTMDFIFTNSLYTSACLSAYLGIPMSRSTCLYGGADTEKFTSYNSDRAYIPQTRTDNLIAILGGCIRKNAQNLTHAFCRAYKDGLIPRKATLVLLSCQRFREELDDITLFYGLQPGRQVSILEYIPDAEMVKLLSLSRASIFPPVYEGLGLPILESYTAGTPCFAANTSATKEFVPADSAFDPFDVDDMRDMICRIYMDDDLCRRNLAFGRRLIQNVNWVHSARILIETLKQAGLKVCA